MRFFWRILTVLLVLLATAAPAAAGGWLKVSESDPIGNVTWSDAPGNAGYASPHGGFVNSSNLCKTCHAVHDGGDDSYRLLKSGVNDFEAGADRTQGELIGEEGAGNKRTTECMYCHDGSAGLTLKRPYELSALGITVRGQHALGSTEIPDSDINGGAGNIGYLPDRNPVAAGGNGAELDCYQCHSVHGANTIGHDSDHDGVPDPVALNGLAYDGNDGFESWNTKILRVDPSGDGNPLGVGANGMTADELANEPAAVRSGFCGDCHNRNPNWAVTADDTDRPNAASHVQGSGVDGLLEVYGTLDVAVAAHKGPVQGCRGCHAGSSDYTLSGSSRFPHQSRGWKLMWDSYDSAGQPLLVGDPQRNLPAMDQTCLKCHPVDNEFETGQDYSDASTEESLCFRCHKVSSFAGAPDVQAEINKAYGHPTSLSGVHVGDDETQGELGGANRHAECVDCHNVKAPQGLGKAYAGMWGVSVTNGAAGTTPVFTKVSGAGSEYELCFKCHSAYVTQRSNTTYSGAAIYENPVGADLGQSDKALEFNPKNNAFHPVEGPGRNVSSNLNAQLLDAGLTTGSEIKCSDCHNSDETGGAVGPASDSTFTPQGPHGSDSRPILRANYFLDIAGAKPYDADNFRLCFLCHSETKLMSNAGWGTGIPKTNFYVNSVWNKNLHYVHLVVLPDPDYYDMGVTCRNCHYNIHSNQEAPNTQYVWGSGASWTKSSTPPDGVKTHLVNFSPDLLPLGTDTYLGARTKPEWKIDTDTGIRYCYMRCHGLPMIGKAYRPPSGDDTWTYPVE